MVNLKDSLPKDKKGAGVSSPSDTVKGRYDICLSIVRQYIDYLCTTSSDKVFVQASMLEVADAFVEEYGFGGKFIDACELYSLKKFQVNFNNVLNQLEEDQTCEGILNTVITDMHKKDIVGRFDTRFRKVFEL